MVNGSAKSVTSIVIDYELLRELKELSNKTGKSVSKLVEEILSDYVKRQNWKNFAIKKLEEALQLIEPKGEGAFAYILVQQAIKVLKGRDPCEMLRLIVEEDCNLQCTSKGVGDVINY